MGADRGGRARHELAAAIAALFELPPPLDSDADEAWRAMLGSRFGTVRPFLKLLVAVVDFGTTPEGLPVLTALKSLPDLMGRKKAGPAEIDTGRAGSWRRLVLSAPHLEPGTVDWKTYTFCVLEQFHRMLRSKQVFAKNSSASATGTRRNAGHLPPFRGAASHAIDPEPWGPPTSCRRLRRTRSRLSRGDRESAGKKASSFQRAAERQCWCTPTTPPAFSHCPTGRTALGAADRPATRDSTGPALAVLRSRPSRPTASGPTNCTSPLSGPTRSRSKTAKRTAPTRSTRPTERAHPTPSRLLSVVNVGSQADLTLSWTSSDMTRSAPRPRPQRPVLLNTRYMDAAVPQLRAEGFDVRDEDIARLFPFVRHHVNVLGRYSFQLPDRPGGLRPLRDEDAIDEE